jgi:hypothetical protein
MFTDNSVGYAFIMLPLAVLIGCAVGASTRGAQTG